MGNIADYRYNGLILGGARPTQFQVNIEFPDLAEIPADITRRASFLVEASELPASILGKVPVPFQGRKVNYAGDRDFIDWRTTVRNDEDFPVKNALEAWHNAINMIVSNRMDERVAQTIPSLGGSYKTTALITQFSKTGPREIDGAGAIKTYQFDGIFPLEVGPIRVAWEDTNQIEIFDVVWAYDWWIPYERAGGSPQFPVDQD